MLVEDAQVVGSERLFYNLLLRVGALGKYQYISLFIWAIIYMLSSSVIYFNPFLFYQSPYACADLSQSQCNTMVCSLPEELRYQYIDQTPSTLIDKFGDYRCSDGSQLKFYQSLIYLSGVFGLLAGTYLNSFVRKKLLLEICEIASFVCFALMLLVDNFPFVIVLLSILNSLQYIINDLVICFVTETVLQEQRGKQMIILFLFFGGGSLADGILFKYFSWQTILVFYFMVPIVIIFCGLKWYIRQTPFDLVTNFTAEEAHADFHWIALENGNEDTHEITIDELRKMRQEYEQNMRRKQRENIHWVDLFRFKSLRMDTVYCCIIHFFIYYNFSAPLLAVDQFTADIHNNEIIFSIATMVSCVACYFFLDELPRKKTTIIAIIISCVFIIPIFFASQCTQDCGRLNLMQSSGLFVFRMLMESIYQILYFIQNELFPTQIRSMLFLISAVIGNTSTIFVPLVAGLNETYSFLLPGTFVLSTVIIVISTCQIRETLGVPPPEIIAELEYAPAKNSE